VSNSPAPQSPYSDETPATAPEEKPMGFFEHLEELRWTLVKCAVVYVVFAILIGYFMKEFNDVLLWPFNHVKSESPNLTLDLGTTTIMESFNVVIEICLFGALAPALPFILFFLGQFVAPALTPSEKRLVFPACCTALFLFLAGCAFSFFFLIPSTLRVSVEINQMLGFMMRWTPGSYYSLLCWLVIGVGLAFEFPLVIVILIYIGILQVATLRKYRRHAVVAIFIIAAIVTPTPDPITQTIFAIPLYVLYELSIIVGARIEKKRLERKTA
jgi:sec-independent protein translocase protein TatC